MQGTFAQGSRYRKRPGFAVSMFEVFGIGRASGVSGMIFSDVLTAGALRCNFCHAVCVLIVLFFKRAAHVRVARCPF